MIPNASKPGIQARWSGRVFCHVRKFMPRRCGTQRGNTAKRQSTLCRLVRASTHPRPNSANWKGIPGFFEALDCCAPRILSAYWSLASQRIGAIGAITSRGTCHEPNIRTTPPAASGPRKHRTGPATCRRRPAVGFAARHRDLAGSIVDRIKRLTAVDIPGRNIAH